MLHSKLVTRKVAEGVNTKNLQKYLSAYDKDDKVSYMTLALLPKEGEVKLKLTNSNQKEGEMIKKREKLQKIENDSMRYEEGDFSFWHYLTVLT